MVIFWWTALGAQARTVPLHSVLESGGDVRRLNGEAKH